MSKIYLNASLFILLLIISSNVYAQGLELSPITLDPPSGSCQYTWHATVTNTSNQTISGNISAQGVQGDGQGYWKGAGGTSIQSLNPGESRDKFSHFNRMPNGTEFKVKVSLDGSIVAESYIPLPQEANPNLEIINAQFDNNNYTIDIRNNDTNNPITNVVVQCFKAQSSDPISYSPCGGRNLECIPAGGVGQRIGPPQPGYDIFKILVYHNSQKIIEQVFGDSQETPSEAGDSGESNSDSEGGRTPGRLKGYKMPRVLPVKASVQKKVKQPVKVESSNGASKKIEPPKETEKPVVVDPVGPQPSPLDVYKSKSSTSNPYKMQAPKSIDEEFGGGDFYKGSGF